VKTHNLNTINIQITRESPVTRVSISAEVEIVLCCFLITSIEKAFRDAFLSLAKEALGQFLCLLDEQLLAKKEPGTRICRLISRTFLTTLGKVNFVYRQAKRNGTYFSPLLELLGISKKQVISSTVKEQPVDASIYASFRKALKICRNGISLSSLWKAVQDKGKRYRDRIERSIYYYSEGDSFLSASPFDFASVMIDEIWIRGRKKKKWEKVKVARLSVARFKDDKHVFEPIRVYATLESQAVFLKKASQFFNAVSGLDNIQNIVVLTDGCPMGKKFCGFYAGACWQLDWWHLWDKVRKGCKFEADLQKEIWELLNVEKIDEALGVLYAYLEAMKAMEKNLSKTLDGLPSDSSLPIKPRVFWSLRKIDELKQLITYLENNRIGIYGVKHFAGKIPGEHLPFGSGPVERLQAVMIAYRMKDQGKHWSINGAENMASLLSREWNGKDVEQTIDSLLAGLSGWNDLDSNASNVNPSFLEKSSICSKPAGMQFSPLPTSSVYLLSSGKVNQVYHSLKNLSELKLLPGIAGKTEERRDEVLID